MRLDKAVHTLYPEFSRSKIQSFIKNQFVTVNNQIITKPSYVCAPSYVITLLIESQPYVSRAADKLLKACSIFHPDLNDKIAVDIGASTGGFSQVLLEEGVRKIYAVDVGKNQLHPKLKQDSRIVSIENYNARFITSSIFSELPTFFTMDVSFISSKLILPSLLKAIHKDSFGILLWKPQFEVGPKKSSHGIVKDRSVIREALNQSCCFFVSLQLYPIDITFSPIKGGQGNIEFLIYLSKMIGRRTINESEIARTINEGWNFFSKTG